MFLSWPVPGLEQTTGLVGLWTGWSFLYFKQLFRFITTNLPGRGLLASGKLNGLHADLYWPQWGKFCFLFFISFLESIKWKCHSSFLLPLLRCNWHIILYKFKVYVWWFHICIYCERITIRLVQTSLSSDSYHFVCVFVCVCVCVPLNIFLHHSPFSTL